ncbi:MAG: hypothetical protein ABI903_13050 [Actinomycetota bacterium]
MAGTEHCDRPERRRFITRHHVEDAAASGDAIRVQGRDVVTDEAAQRAADLGVRIERKAVARTASGSSVTTSSSTTPTATAASDPDLRRAVRAAVVAELGSETPGLDLVIDRVLKSRSR